MDIYFNGEKREIFPLKSRNTLKFLKSAIEQWMKNINNYNIKVVFNNGEQLHPVVFTTDIYDNMTFEKQSDLIKGGNIYVTTNKKIGEIRIRNTGRGISYPSVAGFKNVPAWSRGASPWKQLSPFIIGPVLFEENNKEKEALIFENFWQGFKVWKSVDKQNKKNWKWPTEIHVDDNDNPNEKWYKWHDALLKNVLPVRRPNGRKIPLYAWWKNQKLGVIESRKEIYIPYLQQLYRKHPIYINLLNEVKKGQNIIILEPDGPKHELSKWNTG